MVITLLFLFNGCVLTQGYPSDLIGNLEPINKDDSYQKVIEQQQTSNSDKSKKMALQKLSSLNSCFLLKFI
jgi:hypothetical protein